MSELRRTIISASGSIDLSEYLLKEEAETLYATLDLVSLKANDTAVVHKVGDESIAGTKTFNGVVHFLGTARPTYEGVNLAILSDISSKQDTLVSGTNIKTINGQTILGSGDIAISGGSDANVQAVDTGDVLDDVTVDYATKTYVDGLVGDINSVLESIISGGTNALQENLILYGTLTRAAEYNYFYSLYPVESDITITADWEHPINGSQTLVCHISKGNTKIDETLTATYEFTNVVITPESDSKYIYIYNS